jgi:hypothetical protein
MYKELATTIFDQFFFFCLWLWYILQVILYIGERVRAPTEGWCQIGYISVDWRQQRLVAAGRCIFLWLLWRSVAPVGVDRSRSDDTRNKKMMIVKSPSGWRWLLLGLDRLIPRRQIAVVHDVVISHWMLLGCLVLLGWRRPINHPQRWHRRANEWPAAGRVDRWRSRA